jgi:coproporphyrinogen III oxidase-like Fe-S oxidoreductase
VERYCASVECGRLPLASHEVLTPRQALAERLILGLRTSDGIPAGQLAERGALEHRGRLPAVLDAWRERGLLAERDGRVRLTEAGFLLSDALFTELL